MSTQKVKDSLQKAKNYQVLALSKAKGNITQAIDTALDQFQAEVDADKLKAAIAEGVEAQLAAADLYSHQAEYELTEMVNEYDSTIAALQDNVAQKEVEIAQKTLSAKQSQDTIVALEAKVADLTQDLSATKSDLATTLEQKEAAAKKAASYKEQYEAVIAPSAGPVAQIPAAQLPPPPAPGEEEDEPNEHASLLERGVALYNKMTAESKRKKASL